MGKLAHDKYPIKGQVICCLIGIVLWLSQYLPVLEQKERLACFIEQLGVGILVFGATAFYLTHKYSMLASQQLDNIGHDIKELTVNSFQLIKNSRDSGVERIYPSRVEIDNYRADDFKERIIKEFNSLIIKNEKTQIKMLGISLRAFFCNLGEFSDLIEKMMKNSNISFEILLINPFSNQAGYRAERESNITFSDVKNLIQSQLFLDIQQCVHNLKKLNCKRISVRFYDTSPSCMLLFVNRSVFMEAYHYGKAGVGGTKGGKVPVLEFKKESNAYQELEGHFSYVWKKSENLTMTTDFLNEIVSPFKNETIINSINKRLYWLGKS